ncbi:methyltransferase domain-containing protein [Candidatus Collierbacteria bacterium]|nr:methyltransferase domain-containing protein [Candidatus Collierbacteria bacterium]
MNKKWLQFLRCPMCEGNRLYYNAFGRKSAENGVVSCFACGNWFLVEDDILELLPEVLNFKRKREFFFEHKAKFLPLNITKPPRKIESNKEIRYKTEQGKFFDTFFEKERKNYQESVFWKAEYSLSLMPVRKMIRDGDMLIDAGCGEGYCSFLLHRNGVQIIGFDVSRHSIERAIAKAKHKGIEREVFFFVGDAENVPLRSNLADHYILFALLHHLTNPNLALSHISRLLKPKGHYFIHDNNDSKFRFLFDWLMRLFPLWKEKAAKEAKFSAHRMRDMLRQSGLSGSVGTQVFLPPHVFNLFQAEITIHILSITNKIGSKIPWFRNQGGIVLAHGNFKNRLYDAEKDTLESMSQAAWYNRWTLHKFRKFVVGNILEVGCGIGTFTRELMQFGPVYAIDNNQNCVNITKKNITGRIKVELGDIEKGGSLFGDKKFDTVVCINVLEHIRNDNQALTNIFRKLKPRGYLIALVPIHQFLYGTIDEAIGHYRRYTVPHFRTMLEKNHFEIIFSRKLNFLGAIGWWVAGRLLQNSIVDKKYLRVFDAIAPFVLSVEDLIEPPIGTSLLVVAKRKD